MTAVTTKEQSIFPCSENELEGFTAGGLVCPNECNDGWYFYEEVTASAQVFVSPDDKITVCVADVNFEGSYDPRFECASCRFVVPADQVTYDDI